MVMICLKNNNNRLKTIIGLWIACIIAQGRELVFDPNPLSEINFKELKGLNVYLSSISADHQYAFVSAREGGVIIVSLQNVIHPQIVHIIPTLQAQYLQVQNNILFVGDILDGLLIYNVTDVLKPELLSKWQDYKHIQALIVTKDQQIAYALGNGIVYCINISDLKNPITVSMNGVIAPDSYRLKLSLDETHLAVSNHIQGVQLMDLRYKKQIIMRANKNPKFVTWDCIFTPDQTSIYAVDAYYGLFYAYVKPIFDMPVGSTDLYNLVFKSIVVTPQVFQSIAITSDGLFIVLGLRSVGLRLYEINENKYDQPVFVQRMEGEYLSNDVQFSQNDNEQFAYVTNGMSLLIYQQVELQTNKDFPNIFNTFQSSQLYTSDDYWPWQIICLSDNQHVILTATTEFTGIYSIKNNYYPQLVGSVPQVDGHFGGVQVSKDLKTLFVGATQSGLSIYDISVFSAAQLKTQYTPLDPTKYMNQGIGVTMDKSGKVIVLANGFYGLGIVDVTDPFNFVEIGKFINDQFPCGFEKCQITIDQTTIICACREVGLIFFDFTKRQLQLVYLLPKLGSEYMILSQDEKLAFVCNGFQGIVIVNIQNKFAPFVVSEQPLDGWAQSLVTIFDEKYILATQIEKGELVIVNIEDINNPYIQSKLEFPNENSNSVCITPDNQSAYFIGNMGLRYIPIQTELTVHTQIQVQMQDSDGLIYYQNIVKNQSLLVGQTVQVFFVPLFTQQQVKFSNAYYYRNFEKNVLPFWILFYENKNMISMQIDKSGAQNTFSNERKGENIIILDCLTSLTSTSFVSALISNDLSLQIYTSLVNQSYLDSQGFLTSKLDPTIQFYLDFFNDSNFTQDKVGDSQTVQNIQQEIKLLLVFSRTQYPIRFFVASSLVFNYDRKVNPNQSIIESPSLQISLLLQIVQYGVFVKKSFDGVLASFSDDQTSLKISGQTLYVNQILSQQIQIANKTSNLTECIVDFIISDSSNFDISKQIPLSELSFISLHSPIELNQANNLQIQFNKYYPGSNVDVEQRFQFSFDMNTFKQKDNLPLKFQAYVAESSLISTEITTGDWIEFNDFNLGFSGQKSFSSLLSTYTIKVVASDGYSEMSDTFSMDFNRVPFLYVVQLIIQIVGPILGVFGIWKYRAEIYLLLMERFYFFSNESVVVGEVFKKQIVLMDEIWIDSEKLWTEFKQKNKKIESEIIQEYTMNQKIDIAVIMARIYTIYSDALKKYPNIDPREFEFLDSRLVRIYKRFCYEIVLNQDKNTMMAIKQLKIIGTRTFTRKDWYKSFVKVTPKFDVAKNKIVQQSTQQKQSPPVLTQRETGHGNYFDGNNSIDSKRECQGLDLNSQDDHHMNDLKMLPPTMVDDHLTNRENQTKSNLFQVIDFESYGSKLPQTSGRNYDQQHPLTTANKELFTQRKDSKDSPQNNQNNLQIEEFNNFNPFPEMTVKMELIVSSLAVAKPNLKWDKKLLQEILILEASGIQNKSPNRFNPAIGESLHLFSHQLLQVQAFKRDQEDSCCLCLKKCLKANYSPIGLNQNNPLPKWLNCQIIDGIIHIWGTPKSNDEPELLIRVIDQLTFTILSFHIFIKDKDGNELRDKSHQSMSKIKSENNLVASMRMQRQSQQQQQQQQLQGKQEGDNQIKTLQTITTPRLSIFCKETIRTDYQKRKVRSQQAIPTNMIALQQQELSEIKELQSPLKVVKLNQPDDSPSKKQERNRQEKLKKLIDDKVIKETSIDIDISDLDEEDNVDNYDDDDDDDDDDNDVAEHQSNNLEEKDNNEDFHKVTITNYIKTQK